MAIPPLASNQGMPRARRVSIHPEYLHPRPSRSRRVSLAHDCDQALFSALSRHRSSISSGRRRSWLPFSFLEEKDDMSHKKVVFEPTYKMKPDKPFTNRPVLQIIEKTLASQLEGETYSPEMCSRMSETLADLIRDRVKELDFQRHKIVCQVTIGPLAGQAVRIASRCLWDDQTDKHVSHVYQNNSLYAVATVFGVYFE